MILVTGAGGFIGGQVCALLAGRGHELLAVDRHFPGSRPYRTATGDLADPEFSASLFEHGPFRAVVHLASLLNTASRRQPQAAARVNIGASLDLLAAAARAGVPRFVYGSSISVYGTKPAGQYGPVAEGEPAAPEDVYGASKRFVEIAGTTGQGPGRTQFVALRIASVVGPGAINTSSPWRSAIFECLRPNGPAAVRLPHPPDETLPLVHVQDVAEAIACLVSAPQVAHSLYNTPAESWRLGDLASAVRSLNPQAVLSFGAAPLSGIPQVIDGCRFADEFAFRPAPLLVRLQAAAQEVGRVE